MITDEKKSRIESLTEEEMKTEIDLGDKSRFQREKFAYLKEHYRQRREVKADSASKSYFEITKYLALHNSQYQKTIGTLLASTVASEVGLLGFDFSNLIDAGVMQTETKKLLISMGPYIIFGIASFLFLILNRYFMDKYKDPSKLTDEELDKLIKYL